jgi:hypothetical protein
VNKLLAIILLIALRAAAIAQQDSAFRKIRVIGKDIVNFTVDNLGNIYTLDKNDLLEKRNVQGDSVAVFNDVRKYGKVYSIDATNPLKVLLYYKDFGTIVVLDRLLNMRNTIDLRQQGIFQAKAVAQSYDNGVWVYDEQEAKLKRLNDEGNVVNQSFDFRQMMESAPSPVQIIDQDKLVYLYDTTQGLFVFDYYGSLKNKVALLGWKDFQVIDNNVFGRKGSFFERYEPGTLSLREMRIDDPIAGSDRIKITLNRLYSLKDGVITIYER